MTYTAAITKLEEIVREIESGEIDVDTLTERVRQASELIRLCKEKLRNTQHAVEKTLLDMKAEGGNEEE